MAGSIDDSAPRGRPILFDVTLSFRSLGARPDGILRAERAFAAGLLERSDLSVTWCRYDPRTRGLLRMHPRDVAFLVRYVRQGERRPRGFRKVLADIVELARSADARRYRRLRWDIGRIVPYWLRSRAIDASSIRPDTVYVLAGMIFDTHDTGLVAQLRKATGMSVFAMCYDVLPIVHPEYFQSPEVVERFRAQTTLLLSTADRIASISRSARDDLAAFARRGGIASPDLTILILGHDIRRAPCQRPVSLPPLKSRGFVLSVGNINIRKNHALLYRVWRRLAERGAMPPLVIVGRVGWLADDVLAAIRSDPSVRECIHLIHDADDEALAWLYGNCLFTLYPSFYEGWGLPVSESLAFGRYCITSSTSSMPEAAAGLAATLDPRDDDAWARAVAALIDRPEFLASHEREIAACYRVRRWADAVDDLVGQVLSTPAPTGIGP